MSSSSQDQDLQYNQIYDIFLHENNSFKSNNSSIIHHSLDLLLNSCYYPYPPSFLDIKLCKFLFVSNTTTKLRILRTLSLLIEKDSNVYNFLLTYIYFLFSDPYCVISTVKFISQIIKPSLFFNLLPVFEELDTINSSIIQRYLLFTTFSVYRQDHRYFKFLYLRLRSAFFDNSLRIYTFSIFAEIPEHISDFSDLFESIALILTHTKSPIIFSSICRTITHATKSPQWPGKSLEFKILLDFEKTITLPDFPIQNIISLGHLISNFSLESLITSTTLSTLFKILSSHLTPEKFDQMSLNSCYCILKSLESLSQYATPNEKILSKLSPQKYEVCQIDPIIQALISTSLQKGQIQKKDATLSDLDISSLTLLGNCIAKGYPAGILFAVAEPAEKAGFSYIDFIFDYYVQAIQYTKKYELQKPETLYQKQLVPMQFQPSPKKNKKSSTKNLQTKPDTQNECEIGYKVFKQLPSILGMLFNKITDNKLLQHLYENCKSRLQFFQDDPCGRFFATLFAEKSEDNNDIKFFSLSLQKEISQSFESHIITEMINYCLRIDTNLDGIVVNRLRNHVYSNNRNLRQLSIQLLEINSESY